MPSVLNVGGNNKTIALPPCYSGWDHILLDIDPKTHPDVLCDARELHTLPAERYDAVYCAHNLEHYHKHEVPKVLQGFRHVLRNDGFVHIRVPDLGGLMKHVVEKGLDIEDVVYKSSAGPVTVRDMIYGFAPEIEKSGSDYFSHRTGYTPRSLGRHLATARFSHVFAGVNSLEIVAFAFKQNPPLHLRRSFGLPDTGGETGA